jgi:hypothetical protein
VAAVPKVQPRYLKKKKKSKRNGKLKSAPSIEPYKYELLAASQYLTFEFMENNPSYY